MKTSHKIILGVAAVTTAFAVGRWTKPEVVKVETKIVEVEKKTKKTEVKRKKTKTVITRPDGTKEEHTTTETEKKDKESSDSSKNTDSKSETRSSPSLTTLGVMGAMQIGSPNPVWGLQVYRPVLGPIGIGAFGLTNNIFGVTIGVSF